MNVNQYLQSLLQDQTISTISDEHKTLIAKRDEVEKILRAAFPDADITFKYGGSKAKHTMILANFDLDLICYFGRNDDAAGSSLLEVYETIQAKLSEHYHVTPKTSALRLEEGEDNCYTHVDVVPGRFIDDTKTDVFLHQNGSKKERLLTNTKTHVEHIRDSGLTEAIRLLKLWRECSPFTLKTFILELLAVDVLTPLKKKSLEEQLLAFWQEVRDNVDKLAVTDPANSGNDRMKLLTARNLV